MSSTTTTVVDRLITISAAADATSVPLGTWRNWIARGRCPLPIIRVGRLVRVRESDLVRLIAGEITMPPRPPQAGAGSGAAPEGRKNQHEREE